jgi:hypothetical protein
MGAKTPSIMTFGIMTLGIMILGITTLGIMTLSITTSKAEGCYPGVCTIKFFRAVITAL